MIKISQKDYEYFLQQNIGSENILREYKEFYLRKSLTLYDFNDLQDGILTSKVKIFIFQSLIYYFDKYLKKYICSLTNIDKHFLEKLQKENFSKLFIGVSDDGKITGIPIHKSQLPQITTMIESKIEEYYSHLIGLHKCKGINKIIIDDCEFYDFDKIKNIIKKYTNITIHILNKNGSKNSNYSKLNQTIQNTLVEQKEYLEYKSEFDLKKKIKRKYNDKYSQAFHLLIHSDTMIEFQEYMKQFNYPFNEILNLLKDKINIHNKVENYLKNGEYIKKSLFPNDSKKDKYYGEKINLFLYYYKDFKNIMLEKNISIEPFCKKPPIKKINSILKNISCFSEQFYFNNDIFYIMIEIQLPIIKDKRVYLGLKQDKNIKIIKRTYEYNMNMPCTAGF